MKFQTYISKIKSRLDSEIEAAIQNKGTLVLAIKKDTVSICKAITYTKMEKREAATNMVNSIYWNETPSKFGYTIGDWSGRVICNLFYFIVIETEQELVALKKYTSDLDYYLNNLDYKIAGKTCNALENLIVKLGTNVKP